MEEFCVSKWVGRNNKISLKHYENSLKQLKQLALTVHGVPEGLSEGCLLLRFGGLFSERLIFWATYYRVYRNFTVLYRLVKGSHAH